MTAWQFLNRYTGKYRGRLILLLLCAVTYSFLELITPLIFSFFIDNIIDLQPITNGLLNNLVNMVGGVGYIRENLWVGALAVIAVNLVLCLFVYWRGRLNAVISEGVTYEIRNELYRHLQLLPYSFHSSVKTGELIQKCTSDIDVIRRVFAGQLSQMIISVTTAALSLIIMFSRNAKLAWISMISMPLLILYAYVFFNKTQKAFQKSDEAEGRLTTDVQENLSGIRVVKAFNRERYEIDRFEKKNAEYRDLTGEVIRLLGKYWSTSDLICLLQIFVVALTGIFMARAGEITVGTFFVFITYETNMIYPIRNLGRILSDFGKMMVSAGRVCGILNEKEEDVESGSTPEIAGNIEFQHVSFHYEDDPRMILKDVSFKLQKGKVLAIIGPTGSGKSSLVHLLSRLYDCSAGTILIDGHDIRTIQKNYLRKKIGIVLQEPFLYSKTIYDNINIAAGKKQKDMVKAAAKMASIDDVIENFDQGYDTLVGEKGVTLSGGQKQRIAIARTIMNETPILIFDDSLSAVDTETDENIRHAIHSLQKNVSMIIITQRISSAKDADEIIVLEDGVITEQGTHEQLIHEPGLYSRINDIQSQMIEAGDDDEC